MSRRLRNLVAVFATVALMFGGSIVFTTTAHAAPGDPVVFADQNLEDAVNDALGQNSGDTITEGQAAGITGLNVTNAGITDLTGIEHLTGLWFLGLNNNNLTDVSSLSGLTNLTTLYLGDNGITDVSSLSGLTNLSLLDLSGNGITDVSSLSGLTNLIRLYLSGNVITDVSSLSGLTDLTDLRLGGNDITDVSSLSGLTSLTVLQLRGNGIVDVSSLSGMTSLTALELYNNGITDVSSLSGLTNLTYLSLYDNGITDVSPLSGLTNLTDLRLSNQSVTMPSAVVSQSTANPVVSVTGVQVPVSSSDAGFAYLGAANEWIFDTTGTKALTWSTLVSVGDATLVQFDGTISQDITAVPPLVAAIPQNPDVVDAVCVNGDISGPQITLPVTEGIDYAIEGDVTPGATVTVRATPTADHYVILEPGSDWVGDGHDRSVTFEVTLNTVDCAATPVVDGDKNSSTTSKDELAKTGANQSVTTFGVLGALLTLAGVALVAVRRRVANC